MVNFCEKKYKFWGGCFDAKCTGHRSLKIRFKRDREFLVKTHSHFLFRAMKNQNKDPKQTDEKEKKMMSRW